MALLTPYFNLKTKMFKRKICFIVTAGFEKNFFYIVHLHFVSPYTLKCGLSLGVSLCWGKFCLVSHPVNSV